MSHQPEKETGIKNIERLRVMRGDELSRNVLDLVGCQSVNVGTVMPLRVCMSPQRLRLGRLRGRGDVRRAASFVPFFFGLKEKTLSCRGGPCMYILLFF